MSQMPIAPTQYTYNDSLPPAPMHSYFFLLTIPLVAASWVISLVSQSIVTAQIGNSFVGPLWFAIILQFLTLLILFYGLLTDTLPAFHATLNTFTALVIVFAVLGVDRNIFNPIIPAQKALSAGWLVLAVLNSLWVIYFTTAPAHSAAYTLPPIQLGLRLASNRRAPPKDPADHPDQARSIPSLRTNVDVFPSPRVPRSSGTPTFSDSRPASHPHSPTPTQTQTQTQTHGRTGSQPASSVMTDSHTQARASGSGWASACARSESATPTHQTAQSIRSSLRSTNTYTNATKEPGPSSPSSSVDPAGGAGGAGADADADDGGTDALSLPFPLPLPQQKEYPWRAKALYPYKDKKKPADPNELAFAKDEILEIADKSGKWWEGRKVDGTVGIAPSNYLQLL